MSRCYSELSRLKSFEERYQYLRLDGIVGKDTFGFDRYLNQIFYRSSEWKTVRDLVIIRDDGCDLGIIGYEIYGKILIHHMNPICPEDIMQHSRDLLDPEYLVATTHATHNAIHYGDASLLAQSPVARTANDTCPWKTLKGGSTNGKHSRIG